MPDGLRERKKRETRQRIADIASGLFLVRGYDEVTVAEVAEAAGVSKMTVFNYFPRKEDLYLDRHEDRLRELAEVVRGRPAGEPVVAAMRRYQHELLAAKHPLSGAVEGAPAFWAVITASRSLTMRTYEHEREMADLLTGLLTEETGDEVRSRLVAGLLTKTITAVFDRAMSALQAGHDVTDVREMQIGVIDEAFDLLERGIGTFGA